MLESVPVYQLHNMASPLTGPVYLHLFTGKQRDRLGVEVRTADLQERGEE